MYYRLCKKHQIIIKTRSHDVCDTQITPERLAKRKRVEKASTPSKARFSRSNSQNDKQYKTPTRSKLQEDVDLVYELDIKDEKGIPFPIKRLFERQNVSQSYKYRILKDPEPRTLSKSKIKKDKRGRKGIASETQLAAMEHILWLEGFEGRSMTWEQLSTSIYYEVRGRTICRAMGQKGYRQCIACRRGFVDPELAKKRKK